MLLFVILTCIHVIFLGAIYGRLDGGGISKTNEWVERTLIMFFFVLACASFAGYWSLFAYVGVLGIATGHGQYFPMQGLLGQKSFVERVDPFVSLFFGKDWRVQFDEKHVFTDEEKAYFKKIKPFLFWRNNFGMFTTGLLVGLPASIIALSFGHVLPAVIFSLTGIVKSIAYILGYAIFRNTESAEYMNGGLRNVICIFVILYFLL